jgi:hypothetical protein
VCLLGLNYGAPCNRTPPRQQPLMTIDATPLLRLYARWRNSQLESSTPAEKQQRQLMWLLKRAETTRFAKEHAFSSISSVEDFQRRVPLRTYEDFWTQFWKESFPVLDSVTWPGVVRHFAVSSGTSSGTTKYIPCTDEVLASNRKAAFDLLVYHVNNRPNSRILGGKNFLLGGSTELTSPAPGIFFGDLSGIVAKHIPWWLASRYFPPAELTALKSWEEKVDVFARASLSEDIRMISGVPAWMMIFFDYLRKIASEAKGVKSSDDLRLCDIYSNLEMVVHGGVNFSPYIERFSEILSDSHAELREVYPASEGFIAIADRGYGDGLRLNLDHGIFYEFVPLSELGGEKPTRHWIKNVQPDVNYAVVMSSCAGLWSYVIGDTVRFVDTSQRSAVLVTGRTSYYLSAFGEHLIGEEVDDGVTTAARENGYVVSDYSVGPVYPKGEGDLGGHIFIVEFVGGVVPSSEELAPFIIALDRRLSERNEDYEAHRSNGFGLRAPRVVAVPGGTFSDWMRSRGKLGGQNKVPRIITKQEILDDLLKFVGVAGV